MLDEIASKWSTCRRCDLAKTRTHVVVGERFGRDASMSLLLVVGEAPGASEDAQGRPFVGPSGRLLREEILGPAGVQNAYITNIVGCRPVGNATPTPDQITACAPRLQQLAEALGPAALLLVGKTAEEAERSGLLPQTSIVHPSFLLRKGHPNAETRRRVEACVGSVRRLLSQVATSSAATTEPEHAHDWCRVGEWRHESRPPIPMIRCDGCQTLQPPGR